MPSKYISFLFILLLNFNISGAGTPKTKELKDYFKDLPFPMQEIKEPQFPDYSVSIMEYGAIADGLTLNTKAFEKAIASCSEAGGGTVIVPPGTWLTGPIKLVSNIKLHIEKGALVQFSKNIKDFPFIAGLDGKSKRFIITPLIYAYKSKNIAITGEGVFDGAGEVWRYAKKIDMIELQWKSLIASGGVTTPNGEQWWPSKESMEGQKFLEGIEKSGRIPTLEEYTKTREYLRPNQLQFEECGDILIDGPTFNNSPKHHLVPSHCENVIIRNTKVISPEYGQNTDAIDPRSCRNVIIYNCLVDVGDDGICLKPADIIASQTPGPSCQNIIVADCLVLKAHGGFVIGSESTGGTRNVYVHDCIFIGTDVGLRFKSARDRGGLIENIYFNNIQMRAIKTDAILFDMYYSGGSPEAEAVRDLTIRKAEPVSRLTPQFQNFNVKNIICDGADRAVVINGLPEMSIKNMFLENVSISSKRGAFIADADGVEFNKCRIVPQSGFVFNIIQSCNVTLKGGLYPTSPESFLWATGEKSENIHIIGIDLGKSEKSIKLESNVKAGAVKMK